MANDRIIITPAEAGIIGVQGIERLNNNRDRLMPLLLPGMDGYFYSLEPGSLTIVMAQTHNGKSLFMRRWMERMVHHLQQVGRDEVVVWVDTEMTADALAMGQVASLADLSYEQIIMSRSLDTVALMKAAANIAGLPIYTIATRLGRDGSEVHLTNIRNGIYALANGEVDGTPRKVAAVFVDYLQALPIDPVVRRNRDMDNQRRLQVARDVDTCRVIGSNFDCPVIVGVQAKQSLEATDASKALALPGIYDGQETANIAQRPDRILSLSVASRNYGKGQVLSYHGGTFIVRDGLMFVRVLKQRGFKLAGNTFAYMIEDSADPMTNMTNVWSET